MNRSFENTSGDQPARTDQQAGEARQFWQTLLAGAEPLMTFPTDIARPARIDTTSDAVRFRIDPDTLDRLHALCARESADPEDLFLAAYQVFLYRYSGQEDCIVGVARLGDAGDQAVPLRQAVRATDPFTALLAANKRLREQASPFAHAYLARPTGDEAAPGSHAPVFQHRFAHLRAAGSPDDAQCAPLGILDTAFTIIREPHGAQGVVQFNTSLFEAESAQRWANNLSMLLMSIASAPAAPIGDLELLHPSERQFIARSLDHTATPFRQRFPSVHGGFEQQAAKTPNALALRCGDARLTYAELDARANAIAQHLHEQGVGAGDLVGICTARTPDMIAGVIGVLKLGATYVPMDLKYPVLRLKTIAEEAQLKYLLCDARGRGLLDTAGMREFVLEDIRPAPLTYVSPAIGDDSLCHVIFTSGSTGKPKGVMARHRNVLAFLEWIWATYSVEELQVVMCCSSLCFDLTVFEIWGPLTVGGTIVLVDNPASLVQQPEPGLTLVNTVPTALRLLVDEMAMPGTVKAVNVCGEPLDAQLVQDLFKAYPGVVFYNTYGPTEDTAYSTFFKMTGPVEQDPPIGAPIVHEFGRVVDAHGAQVPVGAVGELLIGGAGVARGYLFKPEQTAERFIEASNHAGEPASAYRTGDFVRLRNDGQLHFVGRRDDQVKLRGFRIDLGDIVNALCQIPGVTDARVLVQKHHTGDVLVAYVSHAEVPAGEHRHPAVSAYIEREAALRLPAFMVPGFFVLFDKLPLNDNGKVDRHALRAIDFDPHHAEQSDEAWTDDERTVAEIWKTTLGLERAGREDDFFQLGGNSLLAVRLIARLNRAFQSNLPTQAVFEERTIAALAARAQREGKAQSLPLARVDLSAGVPPTYPQLAMLMQAQKVSFNLCMAARIDGSVDEAALRRSLQSLLARHDALRARFVKEGDGPQVRMRFSDETPDVLRVVEIGQEGQVMEALHAEWATPFDLNGGSPLRALLIRQAPQQHVLMLSVHHAVTDEWSNNIIKHDLARFYSAELGREVAPLAPLPFRYGDYAAWQASLHRTEDYMRQIGYWMGEFRGLRIEGRFAPSAAAQPVPGRAMAYLELDPPADVEQRLLALAARHGYTRYVVLMAALQLALVEYSGLAQQLVWSPVSRRSQPELEECVGMFSNLAAIAAYADKDMQAGEFLALIERKVAQARGNSDVSALTAVMSDRSLMPQLPMIGLNFIDLPNECEWELEGTAATPIPLRLEQEADLCVLELTVRVTRGGTRTMIAYQPAVLHEDDVRRIVATMWSLVGSFDHEPATRIGELLAARQGAAALG